MNTVVTKGLARGARAGEAALLSQQRYGVAVPRAPAGGWSVMNEMTKNGGWHVVPN